MSNTKSKRFLTERRGLLDLPPDCDKHWGSMPAFDQQDTRAHQQIIVSVRGPEDRAALGKLLGQDLSKQSKRTVSVWWPKAVVGCAADKQYAVEGVVNPRNPVYVISKGRWEQSMTSKALDRMGVPHHVVVEPQEHDAYAAVIDPSKLLVLPFSNLGQGSIPARNWVWEHAVAGGAKWHWILDDNIREFHRTVRNQQFTVATGAIFRAAEDFVDRYENVGQAGFNYFMFVPRKTYMPPYYLNTRIYSCILNRCDLPYRWRGKYNEDTDLSLRILKDGWCTVLFNAFSAFKTTTMKMKGGNTDELYKQDDEFDGRLAMAESLKEQHPDVARVSCKWGRWQHCVDYSKFKRNQLKLKPKSHLPAGCNEYGMFLQSRKTNVRQRLLLIGQAPSKGGDLGDPLGGRIGQRLASLAGASFERYLERTDRMNLFDEWTGESRGKGDAWDAAAAKRRAALFWSEIQGRRILFVGKNVATAFGFGDLPWLEWMEFGIGGSAAVIPHPSGIVLWWNDAANKDAARRFMRSTFEALENSRD